jgi:hypothetical protein
MYKEMRYDSIMMRWKGGESVMGTANAYIGIRVSRSKKRAWQVKAEQEGRTLSKWVARQIDAAERLLPAYAHYEDS